jgi:hypothetical protein
MLVYSFKHLPGATAAQGLGDGRPEMSESMPVFELYTSSACVAKPGFMT